VSPTQRVGQLSAQEKRELLARMAEEGRKTAKRAPLSFAQERLWFLSQLAPDSAFYNQYFAVRVSLDIQIDILERALNEVVNRHEVLRTTFHSVGGQPIQLIAPALHLKLNKIDLSHLPVEDREDQSLRLATEDAQKPFSLSSGPLMRVTVIRLAQEQQLLLFTLHHIISDGWSISILWNEVMAIYGALLDGNPWPLPPLPLQYSDFAIWQREWMTGETLETQVAWWREQLRDLPVLELPPDRPRPLVADFRGALHPVCLPNDLAAALRALSQAQGVTLFITLLAAFKVLLARYTGDDDIVVGVPVANRNRAELEGLIGSFVNTLVMRTNLSGEPSFREALLRVREVALGAQAHQDLPFERLVQELKPQRDTSRNPLFQVTFQLFNSPVHVAARALLPPLFIQRGTSNVDLALDLYEAGESVYGAFEYSTELFDAATIVRLANHYVELLHAIVADPGQSIPRLSMLTADELHLLEAWNQTEMKYPRDVRVDEMVSHQAARTPSHTAVIFENERVCYAELLAKMNQFAARLASLGIGRGVVVAVGLERSVHMVIALLGILRSGAAVVPIDLDLPPERIGFLLSDSGTRHVVTKTGLLERFAAFPGISIICVDQGSTADAKSPPLPPPLPEDIACVLYTSGSTGRPKGVVIPHRALTNQIYWMQSCFGLDSRDRTIHKYSLSFDVGIFEVLLPLAVGACLIIAKPRGHLDPESLAQLVNVENVTLIDVVPSALDLLLDQPHFSGCESLKHILCGGEQLTLALMRRCLEMIPAELHNVYGPTEATVTSTDWTSVADPTLESVPIGRPISNTRAYVLDRYGSLLPIGLVGELYLSGEGLALGYLNRPDLTAEKFVPNPFHGAGSVMYRTGDLARWREDGNLEFVGRADSQIKLRGFRVELGEIEARLEQHPLVREAVVLVEQSSPPAFLWNEDDPAPDSDVLFNYLSRVDSESAEALLTAVEQTDSEQAEFQLTKGEVMIRKHDEFEVFLKLRDSRFLRPPRDSQRNWLLQRALDEFADDLRELDLLARRFVRGSERKSIEGVWEDSPPHYDGKQLVIDGQQVMQKWEAPVMVAMAKVVAESHGDVLEVGFGMGLSASEIQRHGVRSHTIVESNKGVIAELERWRARYPGRDIRVVPGRWQEVAFEPGSFDGILFDAYPVNESEFNDSVIESITFAAEFMPTAAALLRHGGALTYYTNEIDSLSRRHQRLILRYFQSFALSVVRSLMPSEDCQYWWADSMAVVKATK